MNDIKRMSDERFEELAEITEMGSYSIRAVNRELMLALKVERETVEELEVQLAGVNANFTQASFKKLQTQLNAEREKVMVLEKDMAFYKCCALSGEVPAEGSQPSAKGVKSSDDNPPDKCGTETTIHKLHTRMEELEKKYYDLLYHVERKYPGETRHQTALRYLQVANAIQENGMMGKQT